MEPRSLNFQPSPFARLAYTQVTSMLGDTFITVSLAGTFFFTVSPGAARPKVLLYLLLTVLPFSVVSPVIGPLLDRTLSGRRILMAVGFAGRAVLCCLMARNVNSLLIYPEAFGVLVLAKGHQIAKSALVPAVVNDDSLLVRANARIALLSVITALVGGGPAVLILHIGAAWVLLTAACIYAVGVFLALKIPRGDHVAGPISPVGKAELKSRPVLLAGYAMAASRAGVGFMTFFIAFELKQGHKPAWLYGLMLVMSGLGGFVGILIAPWLRKKYRESFLLAGSLIIPGVVSVIAARFSGPSGLAAAAFAIAAGTAAGRQAFDSLLQHEAADALRGRSFARFETRFQVTWVCGALLPVLIPFLSTRWGIFILAIFMLFAGLFYAGSLLPKRAE